MGEGLVVIVRGIIGFFTLLIFARLLGKEQIVQLRSEYQKKLGSEFTLKRFHDKLTSYGSIPVALVRREMLAGR